MVGSINNILTCLRRGASKRDKKLPKYPLPPLRDIAMRTGRTMGVRGPLAWSEPPI
jgi:hypothetical protein